MTQIQTAGAEAKLLPPLAPDRHVCRSFDSIHTVVGRMKRENSKEWGGASYQALRGGIEGQR